MSVAIVDYGSGNLHSAQKAFERMARERATLVSADELRRAGILTTLGGSYTLPFAR